MERVQIRPVAGRSIRGVGPDGTVGVSRRDARLLVKLGRAEFVDAADAPDEKPKRGTPVRKPKKASATKAAPKKAAAKKTAKKTTTKAAKGYKRRDMKAEE